MVNISSFLAFLPAYFLGTFAFCTFSGKTYTLFVSLSLYFFCCYVWTWWRARLHACDATLCSVFMLHSFAPNPVPIHCCSSLSWHFFDVDLTKNCEECKSCPGKKMWNNEDKTDTSTTDGRVLLVRMWSVFGIIRKVSRCKKRQMKKKKQQQKKTHIYLLSFLLGYLMLTTGFHIHCIRNRARNRTHAHTQIPTTKSTN